MHSLSQALRSMEIAGKNEKVNKLNKHKRQMKDAKNLIFVIGLMQILEVYAEVSLTAQHSQYFPTQVWSEINSAKEKLRNLSEQWEWVDEELKLGQCGNPSILLERIMTKHVYQPHVSDNVIKRNQTFSKLSMVLTHILIGGKILVPSQFPNDHTLN